MLAVTDLVAGSQARACSRRHSSLNAAKSFRLEESVGVVPYYFALVRKHLVWYGAFVFLTVHDTPEVSSLHCEQAKSHLVARARIVSLVHQAVHVGELCVLQP